MESHREDIEYEHPFLAIKIFDATRSPKPFPGGIRWHFHKEIEIIVLLEGRYGFYINEDLRMMDKGDVLLIGPNELHRDSNIDYASCLVFQFDVQEQLEHSGLPYYRFFAESPLPLSRLNYIFREQPEARNSVAESVKTIYKESESKKEGYEIAISIEIKKIILTLLRADTERLVPTRENADVLRLKPVLDYIENRIGDKLQVEEACKLANMSYHYFVKYFKKAMGVSFVDYVTLKKINRSERLLLTKDMSISQIGEEVGMSNMAHFYKMFRKFKGCSPNEFRKKMLYDVKL